MKVSFSKTMPANVDMLCIPAFEGKKLPRDLNIDEALIATLQQALDHTKFSGKIGSVLPLYTTSPQIALIGFGPTEELTTPTLNTIGANIEKFFATTNAKTVALRLPHFSDAPLEAGKMAAEICLGAQLHHYTFDHYKTNIREDDKETISDFVIWSEEAEKAEEAFHALQPVKEGITMARDLLNQPPNVLYPETFAKAAKELESLGLKVTILKEKELEALGMRTLLSVGQGSAKESHVAILEWHHGEKDDQPLAFVGKGVTFDTGGISIKPSNLMSEMKYDMGGAAVVVSLMKTLALRKAKVNAVGLVGLVENMPGGKALKPADIIKSYSGQTVEVLDTDAEGRLVLCDLLSYAQDKYKPKSIIDLATLTGAIIVCLGHEYAGLFSNNDTLADQISKAGMAVDEKVWRMPLHKKFDKMMDSKIADMKNLGGKGLSPGSITAAQFLQRFIKDGTAWAHLDIAGTCMLAAADHPLSRSSITGFGVRLLDTFVKENYEA